MVAVLLLLATSVLIACQQPDEPRAAVQAPTQEAPNDDKGRGDEAVEQPESIPDAVEESPWLAGWLYLVNVDGEIIYSEEPEDWEYAQRYDAYRLTADKWNRQQRDGWPFRVIEGGR